ncbi:NADP-dependent oxidoreductase [Massilia aurea]|uniref:NADP-dependent oxidoreductase n=1 Tax=Massilia aurea TaxID=373040 RepID=UPI003461FC71
MRAIVIESYGDNRVVNVVDVARPAPQAGELLVKVRAAGVNPIDWKIRDGAGQRMGMTLPIHLGGEISGTVEQVGAGVAGFSVGDAVFGIIRAGGFADYAMAPAADMVRMPAGLDFVTAAAIPLGALTAWQALFDVAGLARGQRLLITGASGGVGSLAVQIAKAAGAHVTAMASGRNADFVRGLGADVFIDYTAQPFEQVARDMDVVFDTVGGDTFQRAFATLRQRGFLVTSVGFPTEEDGQRNVGVGRVLCKPDAAQLSAIRDLVEARQLQPHVATVLPLEAVTDAFALSKGGRTRGKIVLEISP